MQFIFFFMIFSLTTGLYASTFGKGDANKSKPLHISAKNGMKCNQNTHVCTAYEATMVHDDTILVAQEITAYFTEKDELDHMEARGNVHIKSAETYEGWGQKAFFDMKDGKGRLENKACIKDYAQKREINAEIINFIIKKDGENKSYIEQATAQDHVKIITPKDVALGDTSQYNAQTETMILTGNVKITNMKGQVNGSKAIMNMKTGENQIFANSRKKQSVEILLRPKENNTSKNNP